MDEATKFTLLLGHYYYLPFMLCMQVQVLWLYLFTLSICMQICWHDYPLSPFNCTYFWNLVYNFNNSLSMTPDVDLFMYACISIHACMHVEYIHVRIHVSVFAYLHVSTCVCMCAYVFNLLNLRGSHVLRVKWQQWQT